MYVNGAACLIFIQLLIYSSKKVTHNILVYGQIQIIVAVTSELNISNEEEYEDYTF